MRPDPDRAIWEVIHDPTKGGILTAIALDPDNHMFSICSFDKDDISYDEWFNGIGVTLIPGSIATLESLRKWRLKASSSKRPDLAKLPKKRASQSRPRKLSKNERDEKLGEACQLRLMFPNWPHARIANAVGVHEKTLFKWEQYMDVCIKCGVGSNNRK